MKKKDLIVIGIILVICAIGYFVMGMMQGESNSAEIYYKNEVVETVDLSVNDTYTLKGSYGSFSLEVKDGAYRATNVECPNHDCEKVGWVTTGSSKQIVCVPNEIYIMQSDVIDAVD